MRGSLLVFVLFLTGCASKDEPAGEQQRAAPDPKARQAQKANCRPRLEGGKWVNSCKEQGFMNFRF